MFLTVEYFLPLLEDRIIFHDTKKRRRKQGGGIGMTLDQAKIQAKDQIFWMTWKQLVEACQACGIKVTKSRPQMEHHLLRALTYELVDEL